MKISLFVSYFHISLHVKFRLNFPAKNWIGNREPGGNSRCRQLFSFPARSKRKSGKTKVKVNKKKKKKKKKHVPKLGKSNSMILSLFVWGGRWGGMKQEIDFSKMYKIVNCLLFCGLQFRFLCTFFTIECQYLFHCLKVSFDHTQW